MKNVTEILANVTVSKGRTSNAKYALSGEIVQAAIPAQAMAVLMAMDLTGQTAEEIAMKAEIKTKQSPERIVRYYLPLLTKLNIVKRV